MEITRKIRKDLLLLECYARPNNPRQQAEPALSRSLSQLIAARSRRECRSLYDNVGLKAQHYLFILFSSNNLCYNFERIWGREPNYYEENIFSNNYIYNVFIDFGLSGRAFQSHVAQF